LNASASRLPAYFHPTTVCFVDDNNGFLRSVELEMPPHIPFISFLTPDEALAAVNVPPPRPALAERCFTLDETDPLEPVIRFNLAALEREITDVQRFARLSVLLIDYAMPQMNGLEFSAQVADPDAKRVLLTGVADESTAVEAFNDGLIDLYLPKARLAQAGSLEPFIQTMQHAYFQQYTARLTSNVSMQTPPFMQDPAIVGYFSQLLRKHQIVEYFLVNDPDGYLLLQADGTMFRLIIGNRQQNALALTRAQRCDAPRKWLRRLETGKALAWFYECPEDYPATEAFPWGDIMFAAREIQGTQPWLVAWVQNPPVDIDFDPAQSSFNEFLRRRPRGSPRPD